MDTSAAKSSRAGKLLIALIVLALLALLVVSDMRRREAEKRMMDPSAVKNQANQEQNREAAKRIIERVRKLYMVPEGQEPTVATIVDVNQLRARNAFYAKAKNGDHLIVTTDRAILYDPIADKIIDVVPVQVQAAAGASSSKK